MVNNTMLSTQDLKDVLKEDRDEKIISYQKESKDLRKGDIHVPICRDGLERDSG